MSRFVIGNWKMNLTLAEAVSLAHGSVKIAAKHSGTSIVIAPPLPFLISIREAMGIIPPNFYLASQVVSAQPEGAFTGDVAAKQLKGIVTHCLVGHSERRRYHSETGHSIGEQVKNLLAQGIVPIVCFGEMSQSTQKIFSSQITTDLGQDLYGLKVEEITRCLFAYEPLWAIGTGHAAAPGYVHKATVHMKQWFEKNYGDAPIVLYGGSVNEQNAGLLGSIKELDGLLVGGASLHAKQFGEICALFTPHV